MLFGFSSYLHTMRDTYLTICVFVLFLANSSVVFANDPLRAHYHTLDSLLQQEQKIVTKKQERIELIREGLGARGMTDDDRYQIRMRLYDEYMAFRCDSAMKYIVENIESERSRGHLDRVHACKLRLSHLLAVAGLFDKARTVLQNIPVDELSETTLPEYYNAMQEYYLFMSEQARGTVYSQEYQDSVVMYRERMIALNPQDDYFRIFSEATYRAETGDVDGAIDLLENYRRKEQGGRIHSVLMSTLAYFYSLKGDMQKREEYLLLSAINDERCAIRENNSLRELSMLLLEKGETERAFRYLNASMADASFYGTRLRNLQAAQLMPQIEDAYYQARSRAQNIMIALLVAISLVALILIISRIYRSRLIRRLEEANAHNEEMNRQLEQTVGQLNDANEQLSQTNRVIKESGRIKEEYIGRFFELGGVFINKADEQNKRSSRLLRDRKFEELMKELKSERNLTELTNDYFKQFDEAILSIYPHFVERVNALLEENSRIVPHGEKLTTELRIVALIRLGFTDNQRIASILRSSITTIYTYRSKLKAKAKQKESFEEDVKRMEE